MALLYTSQDTLDLDYFSNIFTNVDEIMKSLKKVNTLNVLIFISQTKERNKSKHNS